MALQTYEIGSGGDYVGVREALAGIGNVLTSDTVFKLVSDYTHSFNDPEIDMNEVSFNGNTLFIDGDGYTITGVSNSSFIYVNAYMSGSIVVSNTNFYRDNAYYQEVVNTAGSHTQNTNSKITFKFCSFSGNSAFTNASGNMFDISNPTVGRYEFYACEFNEWLSNCFDVSGACKVYIEDSFATKVLSIINNGEFYSVSNGSENHVQFKRVYLNVNYGDLYQDGYSSLQTRIADESFISNNKTSGYAFGVIPTEQRNIPYNETQFISLSTSSKYFGIPRTDSVLTTLASQDTNIPDNVVGKNGVTVTTRTVGPYAQYIFIVPPTGVTVDNKQDGVHVEFTPSSDAVANNYKTNLYWRKYDTDSAFDGSAPDVTLDFGTNTYVIPYSELTGANQWYLRLTHGE